MNISNVGANQSYTNYTTKNTNNTSNRAINSIQKAIEEKKKQLDEISKDTTKSAEYIKEKQKEIEQEIKDLEQQLIQLQMQQKQENTEKKAPKKDKNQEEQENLIANDMNIKSSQGLKSLSAEKKRDLTREQIYAENDAGNGYISKSRANDISKLKTAVNKLDNAVVEKYGDINKVVKEKLEEKEEEKEKDMDNEKNTEYPLNDVIKKYKENAFDNYKEIDERK